jgi:hypothetical protein
MFDLSVKISENIWKSMKSNVNMDADAWLSPGM